MEVAKFMGLRVILLLPIALVLAILIITPEPAIRGLAVAVLVILEILRDALTIGETAKLTVSPGTPSAVGGKRKRGQRG